MSEFNIFLSRNDFSVLSAYILKTFNATFVPSVSLYNFKGETLHTVDEIQRHLTNYSEQIAPGLSYFITSPLWSIEPVYFDLVDDNPNLRKHYQAMERYRGPSLHFIPSFGFPSAYVDKLIIGSIADYPYYISGSFLSDKLNGYRTIDRPPALQEAFNEIKKFIRKNGQVVHSTGKFTKSAYAMNDAYQSFKMGGKLIQGDSAFVKREA